MRGRVLDTLERRSSSTATARCSPAGSSTGWSSSTSTSTTRPCWPPSSSWASPGYRPLAPAPPPGAPVERRGARAGRPVRHGHRRRGLGLRQRAAGPRRRPSRLPDRRRPGDQPAVRRVRRRRRLRRAPVVDRRGLGLAREGRPRAPPSSGGPRATAAGPACASAGGRTCPSTSPSSTCAGTRPTPTPAGRASACPPRPSGRRRPRGRPRGSSAAGPGARASRAPSRANLGGAHFRPAPVGAYPAGVSAYGCHQMIGDVWEWTSSDFEPYPGFATFPYREYSEVFFGSGYKVLRGGSWAAVPAGRADDVPQLGLPDPPPDLRRLPLRTATCDRPDGRGPPRPRGPAGRAAARRGRRPHVGAQGAAAQVLLRRPRLGAVRRDHPAARVLPDPVRAEHPRRAGRPRSPGCPGADTLVELGSGTSEKTRLLLDAFAAAGRCAASSPST